MITVDSKIKDHIINDLVENTVEILFPNNSDIATITMDNIVEESMTLKQSICSESTLKFGGCIASEFNISVCDTDDRTFGNNIKGKWIYVRLTQSYLGDYIYPSSTLYPSAKIYPGRQVQEKTWNLFCGYVDKFQRDGDDKHIYKLTAYDYMAKLNQKDGTKSLFEEWQNATFRPLGTIISDFIKLTYHPSVSETSGILTNTFSTNGVKYKIYNYKTRNGHWLLDKNNLVTSGSVLRDCCEMIGVFGFISPFSDALEKKGDTVKGNFRLVYISHTDSPEVYDFYEDLSYEDYIVKGYTDFKWKYGGNLDGKTTEKETTFRPGNTEIPDNETKVYDLTKNVICWQNEDMNTSNWHILNDLYNYKNNKGDPSDITKRFYNCSYTPFTATTDGRPWVQVGDNVQFNVYETDVNGAPLYENGKQKMTVVSSVILSRTLSGIQALTDTLEAKGEL